MVRLKRIKRDDKFIETYYTPEDSQEEGYIKLRLSDGEVVEKKLTSLDEGLPWYFRHARWRLEEIRHDENLRAEDIVMWY